MSIPQTVNDIMTRRMITIRPQDTLISAFRLMNDHGFHHLPVIDEHSFLVGIISDRDISKFSSPFAGSRIQTEQDEATMRIPVEKFMRRDVVTVERSAGLRVCIELMLKHGIHSLPVIDTDHRVVGIVTVTNIMQSYLTVLA